MTTETTPNGLGDIAVGDIANLRCGGRVEIYLVTEDRICVSSGCFWDRYGYYDHANCKHPFDIMAFERKEARGT